MTDAAAERAVYGLRVTGLSDVRELGTTPVLGGEVPVHVSQTQAAPPPAAPPDSQRAVVPLPDGRTLAMERAAGTATFHGAPIPADQLAHPYLGPVAVTFNRWAGRETFHAGAFVGADRAWVVIGPKEAGKSTLMAALAARGVPVLADDVVVTDARDVYAGPRCVDLRHALPATELPMAPARAGERLRVPLPSAPPRVPLGGWLFLAWGPSAIERVRPHALLGRLAARRSWHSLPSDPENLLQLVAAPAWTLSRPKDWSAMDGVVAALLATVAGAVPGDVDAA